MDLISASGGVPVAQQGEAFVAGFPSFDAAILAARRLQWAMQGFSEGGEPQAVSLAILIHTPEDAPGEADGGNLLLPGEQATPGEILLTERISQFFENLPGFPMMTAPGDGLRELLWRAPEEQATRSFDEEVLSRLVEEQGAQSQPQEEPAPTVISDERLVAAGGTGNLEQIPSPPARANSRWVMGGAAAAVLALAAVAFLFWPHEKPAPAADQPAAQTTAPAQAATPAAATNPPAIQGGQAAAAAPAQPAKLSRAEAIAAARAAKNGQKGAPKPSEQPAAENPQPERQQPAKAQPEAPRGRCDLESSQYSGQVAQAEKNLARGKYADAQREFGAVLACDPGNGRAKEGLERARMAAREADGSSSN